MDQAHRGEAALKAGKYDEAITLYTAALKQSPSAATYYTKRSIAYQRTAKFQEALEDAEFAVVAATARSKRELIAQAQLRRAIALYHLQKYGDALFLFGVAKKLDEKEKSVGMWEDKVRMSMKNLEEDDAKKEVTVKEMPDVKLPEASAPSKAVKPVDAAPTSSANTTSNGAGSAGVITQPSVGVQTPASKIRHEWYQSNDSVYVTLLAKGVPKDQAAIEIEDQSISISFPLASGSSYDFSLEPLFAPIDTATSTSNILSTKIELVLKKSTPGQKWAALEGTSSTTSATKPSMAPEDAIAQSTTAAPPAPAAAPAYPTSSRTGPKNWDKIVDSYAKPPTASSKSSKGKGKEKAADLVDDEDEGEAGKDDGYVDYDDEGGDEVNGFFKKLYAGASDDVRKAMMKSYQESGGTALSTNWDEVKRAPVPISPPDGMEAKKWEQ